MPVTVPVSTTVLPLTESLVDARALGSGRAAGAVALGLVAVLVLVLVLVFAIRSRRANHSARSIVHSRPGVRRSVAYARPVRPSILLATVLACSAPPTPAPRPIEVRTEPVRPAKPDPARMGGFPMPPRQFTRAKLDAPLPPKFLSTVSAMFELGFADPRGLPYHEIEVMTGSIWSGEGTPIKTRGWVLPGQHGGKQWAATWSGL